MFTGLYTCWDSFCTRQHKINFVKTLVHHALLTFPTNKLEYKLEFIKNILQ